MVIVHLFLKSYITKKMTSTKKKDPKILFHGKCTSPFDRIQLLEHVVYSRDVMYYMTYLHFIATNRQSL